MFLNRNEKRTMESDVQTLCLEADQQLTKFVDSLHLECLEMYKDNKDDGDEKSNTELPQVSINFDISCLFWF